MIHDVFAGKRVLVTGGLGFIGSNLAIALVELGARVTLLDAMVEGHGGNRWNIQPVVDRVRVNFGDIREQTSLRFLIEGQDYVFHLAGQNDHVLSLTDPFPDIDINIRGSAILLETCRRYNPNARLIYTGTRGEYGSAVTLPVAETQPMNPKGIYELSSLTAQKLFQIYHDNHGVRSVTLRLTNIVGERAQMQHSRFGVANWFVRLALDDETISVFGDGMMCRDFLYVGDTVDAILSAAACEEAYGEVFNVGHSQTWTFRELAEIIVETAGSGSWQLTPFTEERRKQEPGDFASDISKIKRVVGWQPTTSLHEAIVKTVDYYREHREHYW